MNAFIYVFSFNNRKDFLLKQPKVYVNTYRIVTQKYKYIVHLYTRTFRSYTLRSAVLHVGELTCEFHLLLFEYSYEFIF